LVQERGSIINSGNRTSRSISVTLIQQRSVEDSSEIKGSPTFIDEKPSISISPNPTTGILKIEILYLPEGVKINAILYNIQGAVIIKETLSEADEIDISDQPDGIYMLKICTPGINKIWKIIKSSK
jgi:hypothetical protein